MALDARENWLLSVDNQDISTMDLHDQSRSSPIPCPGSITFVEDLDNKGDRFFPGATDSALQSL